MSGERFSIAVGAIDREDPERIREALLAMRRLGKARGTDEG